LIIDDPRYAVLEFERADPRLHPVGGGELGGIAPAVCAAAKPGTASTTKAVKTVTALKIRIIAFSFLLLRE
jgi:hypothetical protein